MVIITDHKCAYKKMLEINTDHKNHLISPFHRWMNHHYAAMPVFFWSILPAGAPQLLQAVQQELSRL